MPPRRFLRAQYYQGLCQILPMELQGFAAISRDASGDYYVSYRASRRCMRNLDYGSP